MHTKLAGHISLQDMIKSVIDDSREKIAASEEKEEKKEMKEKKLMKKEVKEHGHAPSEKEEKAEKKAGVDFNDPDEVEKLASALEFVGEKISADSQYIGKEAPQGGMVLSTMSKVPGEQSYKKDSSKSHNVPQHTPEKKTVDNGGHTATETNDKPGKLLKYLKAKYPAKGPMKTASETVKETVEAKKEESKITENPAKTETTEKVENTEKKSSAVDFILSKLAEGEKERSMGGMTLDSKSGDGPKPPSGSKGGNEARSHIESSKAATNMKKVEGKKPQKKMLTEVLTEPALSKAHDSKVQDNLRNATKGGVKIAAAKAFLHKIAEEGCTCGGKGECKYCKMKKSLEKKSTGMGAGAPPTSPPPATVTPSMS